MAFIDLDSEDPVENASFYNVNDAVGAGCQNMQEDVKVVQFFLNRVYTTEEFKKLKPKGTLTIDGKVGPITRNWIVKFQMDMRNRGNPCMVDGIINKAGNENNPDNFISSISHTKYSIRFMNNVCRKRDTEVYKSLTTHPVVPHDVKLVFLQIQAQGPPMAYGDS